ncbi:hypothetical protein D3C78_950030 [compost metagenome]
MAHATEHRHALADGLAMANYPQPGEARLQLAQDGIAVVFAAIIHVDQFVVVFPCQGGINLTDEGSQIVPLILGGHHYRYID